MISLACQHDNLKKHGKDRKGNQRWKCCKCGATVTKAHHERPLGDMRIDLAEAATVLKMLLEGMSIRACERITGMNRDTICALVLQVGENCNRFLETTVKNMTPKFVEMDELWGFVHCKAKVAVAKNLGPEVGDSWTWLAIDGDSKMILSHAVGKRDESTCLRFLNRLNAATIGRMQVTSDGLGAYTHNVPFCLGSRVDFAQLVKSYASSQTETRYSPATIISAEKIARFGEPDMDHVSTSYSERMNLSVRMHCRRFTRLTNAHSKSAAHHEAMVSLFVAWYNFCRKHETLKGKSPAMVGNLTERVWSIEELLTAAAGC
jgi:transposase-like protein/IS1 family transposase